MESGHPNSNHPQYVAQAHQPVRVQQRSGAATAAITISIFSLIIGLVGITFGAIVLIQNNRPAAVVNNANAAGYYSGNTVEFEETSIAGIVSKVTPAVVSIIAESQQTSYSYFYGSSSKTVQSAGTGMIVTDDGYIITNHHVIEDAKNVQVITDSGDTYDDVDIVGIDPLNDVAYLKINGAYNLPTIPLGDSKTIAVGQPVLAIGNALGAYQNSVTQGIIGGTGRSVAAGDSEGNNVEYLTDMLQTDAAINPGNSGGPLVNAAGEVIGINTAVSTDAQGLGFAIPISATKGMLNNIIENGRSERAYLGLTYIAVTADVAKEYELPVTRGAYILNSENPQNSIVKGGPADVAGVRTKDIITKVNGIEIGAAGSISTLIGEYKSGDTIQLTLIRDGQEMSLNITLGAYSE